MTSASRLRAAIGEELAVLDLRRTAVRPLLWLLPDEVGNRSRVRLLRLAGFSIGAGTTVAGTLTVLGRHATRHLQVGRDCFINVGCMIDASNRVTVGDGVALGHGVLLLSNSHDLGPHERRAGALRSAPIVIGDGAWLGARCTVLPGVTIGPGAVVAAGAVVRADVAPDTLVAGVPAAPRREL